MSAPFEKFVVQSHSVNDFYVRVSAPESVRESMKDIEQFSKSNQEPNLGKMMMERYLFIEDAIREKLERTKAESTR